MVVVSDTTPVNYLLHIGEERLLKELFGEVTIPQEVGLELVKPGGPLTGLDRGTHGFPEGIRLTKEKLPPFTNSKELKRLDDGEREAILLAERLEADIILIDERAGRKVAENRGLQPSGTLGILDAAGKRGLVEIPEVVAKLRKTTFRASPGLYDWLLERHR